MYPGSACLCDRCVKQVGANRGRRVKAEEQNEQRRHQGAAADPAHPDDESDSEPGNDIGNCDKSNRAHPVSNHAGTQAPGFSPWRRQPAERREETYSWRAASGQRQ